MLRNRNHGANQNDLLKWQRWSRFAVPGAILALWLAQDSGKSIAQGPIPAPIVKGGIRVNLQPVAQNLAAAVHLTHANDGSGRLFVADQSGEIILINNGVQQANPYLNLSGMLAPLGGIISPFQDPFRDYDERGLLGLAFHPNFSSPLNPGYGKFYTYTSEPVSGTADFTVPISPGTSFNHQSVIREWTVDPNVNSAVGAVMREIMRIDQPQFNHNGGALNFGNDQNLYVALGDGGGARDRGNGHAVTGNGQDRSNVLGSLLRIDPLGTNSLNGEYGVPGDNPFVGMNGMADEIYAYGLRNPFRFSFDAPTDRLIVADVGQNNIEEIDIVNSGDNLGWNYKEGSFYYDASTNTLSATPIPGVTPSGFSSIDPVLEYDHDEGISVIGGSVYRGSLIPALQGKYVFGDFTQGDFFTPNGRLFYGDLETGVIKEFLIGMDDHPLGMYVKGFGVDADGEIYVLAGTNLGPFRDSNGVGFSGVFKLTAVPEAGMGSWCLALVALMVFRRRVSPGIRRDRV